MFQSSSLPTAFFHVLMHIKLLFLFYFTGRVWGGAGVGVCRWGSVGFSETLNGEMNAVLTCCDLIAGCQEGVEDAEGKRNSKDTGKDPLDTVIRSFVPKAVKELADSFHQICSSSLAAEILSSAKMCRYYNWVSGLGDKVISCQCFGFLLHLYSKKLH